MYIGLVVYEWINHSNRYEFEMSAVLCSILGNAVVSVMPVRMQIAKVEPLNAFRFFLMCASSNLTDKME
jgi:hypothetical protein